MSRPTTELAHLFRALKAPAAARALPKLAERARAEEWSYEQFIATVLKTEIDSRDSHGGQARIKAARFPAHKTLEEFDFAFQSSIKKTTIVHLGQLDFLHARENVILLGPPGPGSHCPPRVHRWANSPRSPPDTLILSPFRRPWVTWMAVSSPRWTLCKTVWRATPSALAAWSSGRYPSGTSGTNLARVSGFRRMRQAAPGVVCWPASSPSLSQR